MTTQLFYDALRSRTNSLWAATFQHPFVKGIGDGTLPCDCYAFFLKQDYIYLIDFCRVFALATAKAGSLGDMSYFAVLLDATLKTEMDLHRRTCNAFGISTQELEQTTPAMITTAYTNLLVRTCYEGSLTDIVAVLLPCAVGYAEIGKRLKEQGLPDDRFYRDWIQTYSAKEFSEFADWLIAKMNQLTAQMTDSDSQRLYRLYVSSARFEYLFFDMSWKKELWTNGIPDESMP